MRFNNDLLITALLLGGAAAFAADNGSPSSVPEIAYDSVPDFLKLPPDLHMGEPSGVAVNSKKHIFVFNRGNSSGPAYGATAAQVPTANTFARLDTTSTRGLLPTPCVSIRTTICGRSTRARTW